LRHAAVDEHQALLQAFPRLFRNVVLIQNPVRRHEAAAADAKLGIAFRRDYAANQFHARPYAAGILPAAARAAEPFAQQRAREHKAPFLLLQRARQRLGLAGRPHADRNQRGEQVGRDRQARAFGNIIDMADQFQSAPRPEDARQQVGQVESRPFNARRHNAGGDHGRLQQTEIVARESKTAARLSRSAVAPRSTLVRRSTGSSITLRLTSTGGRGAVSRP